MHTPRAAGVGLALGVALALAGCGGGTATVTVTCPSQLVSLAEAEPSKRPPAPARMQGRFADLDIYAIQMGQYATALERQARAREAQVAECRELAGED